MTLHITRSALFTALALLLLTPLIVMPGTVFPFVVGKVLWSRGLIEVAFALWVALVLARPEYRGPRTLTRTTSGHTPWR